MIQTSLEVPRRSGRLWMKPRIKRRRGAGREERPVPALERVKVGRRWWILENRWKTPPGVAQRLLGEARSGLYGLWTARHLRGDVPILTADDGYHWFPWFAHRMSPHPPEHRIDQRWVCLETGGMVHLVVYRKPVIQYRAETPGERLSYPTGGLYCTLVSFYEEWAVHPQTPRRLHRIIVHRSPWLFPDPTGALLTSRSGKLDRWGAIRGIFYRWWGWAPPTLSPLVRVRGHRLPNGVHSWGCKDPLHDTHEALRSSDLLGTVEPTPAEDYGEVSDLERLYREISEGRLFAESVVRGGTLLLIRVDRGTPIRTPIRTPTGYSSGYTYGGVWKEGRTMGQGWCSTALYAMVGAV